MKNEKITSRDVDFARWYTDVVKAASLADYSNTKGCIVFEPNGFALWEKMQTVLNQMFVKTGHQNVYMPMLIPESLLNKESELIEGFAPECAWVTVGGSNQLSERLAVRPTSETLFSDYFKNKVESYRDLPKKYNQWCSVMRWEKETRPFLRTREFLWQEGHTVHASAEEAMSETLCILDIYAKFFREYLAIPVITGIKTEKEKFAGAEQTFTCEALMYNGVALQSGTSHYFGQKFAKAYDIKFLNKSNQREFAYQTSWGVTSRMIGALIMVHSDDAGLVLPPRIAPRQVAIVPIGVDEQVMALAYQFEKTLNAAGIVTFVDDSEKSPGFKFAEHEVNGIPVRIEIGPRDLKENKFVVARRDTRTRQTLELGCDLVATIKQLMEDIQTSLFEKALKRRNELTYRTDNLEEIKTIIATKPGFIYAHWCGDAECEQKMKDIQGLKSRCIIDEPVQAGDVCPVCGKPAKHMVVWGLQY